MNIEIFQKCGIVGHVKTIEKLILNLLILNLQQILQIKFFLEKN